MSFWKNNSIVPTWTNFFSGWMNGSKPRILQENPDPRNLRLDPNIGTLRLAGDQDLGQLQEFWSLWYATQTRCRVPLAHLQKVVREGRWEIWILVNKGTIVASIVRRWIKNLHIKEVFFERAGMVDYFCIHPALRKKGIGRILLGTLHNCVKRPFPPHLLLWEGIQPTIPPISAGLFYARRCRKGSEICVKGGSEGEWKRCVSSADIWSEYDTNQGYETELWTIRGKTVAIWNTFHYSVPEGLLIGILIGQSDNDAAELFAEATGHSFGILLRTSYASGWAIDSPFQWVAYNMDASFVSTTFPGLFL